jgi:hypothetical protein
VDAGSRPSVSPLVSPGANDERELLADVAAVRCHVFPNTLSLHSGFLCEAAVTAVELATPRLPIPAALQREPHGRTVAQLEKHSAPPAPPPEGPFAERIRYRTATTAGRTLYRLRQQTFKPVFGIIKDLLGLRRFSPSDPAKVTPEGSWSALPIPANASTASAPPPRGLKPRGATALRPHFDLPLEKAFPSLFSTPNFPHDSEFRNI